MERFNVCSMANNPFKYGEEVLGGDFCNRKKEIATLTEYIKAGNKVLLYSPRRWGKTSLIKEVISRLPKKDHVIIYADLYSMIKEEQFNQILAQAFAKSFDSTVEKTIRTIRGFLSSFVPKITMDPAGNVGFEFGFDSSKRGGVLTEELLDGIAKHISEGKKKGIVIFDEFQQVGELEDDRIEKILRSKIQGHAGIAYIFAGSKRHLLLEMFSDPSRPFYKSVIHFPLPPMPRPELEAFIIAKFEGSKIKIGPKVLSYLLDFTQCHPYYTQELCFHLWGMAANEGKEISVDSVIKTINKILSIENASHQNVFELLTRGQKIAMKALSSLQKDEMPFSSVFLKKEGIATADSFRKALEALVQKGLIEKESGSYVIYDVFFREWLKKRGG